MPENNINQTDDISEKDYLLEVLLHCKDLEQTLSFYTDQLHFNIEMIFPADEPGVALLSGFNQRFRLQKDGLKDHSTFQVRGDFPEEKTIIAPNGSEFHFIRADEEIVLPELKPSLVITHLDKNSQWHNGRAGMRYRDLIPDRQGGRFIASHIHIPDVGPVADYVHFHNIRFQMIFCYKGWVKVVYEDQGEPFILYAGDCVLQPPQIRHRVLESSENLEVIEIGSPAEHLTFADRNMTLPNESINREREFKGQKFVHHEAEKACWIPWREAGFEMRDLGIADATRGLAGAYVIRALEKKGLVNNSLSGRTTDCIIHKEEFLFLFILSGQLQVFIESQGEIRLNAGDSCVIPQKLPHRIIESSDDVEILEVRLSADFNQVKTINC